MTELTLEALGYTRDEARATRRMHDLLQQPQDPCAPPPRWLNRREFWCGYVQRMEGPAICSATWRQRERSLR
jgi:hypothetical protein